MAKANAKKKSPIPSPHPPYYEMIANAISTLKERTGSSQPAIAKFIEEKHKKVLPPNFRKLLSVQLKKLVKSEKLYKVKNSYKLSSSSSSSSTERQAPETKTKPAKVVEKTKKLSQVKTPEALKKKNKKDGTVKKKRSAGVKVKRLSQVKTPEALKKKPNLTPTKRKSTPEPIVSSRPNRRARK